jgi:undecaprenyl-diphosphatase
MKRAAWVALTGSSGFMALTVLWMSVPAWRQLDAAGLNWIQAQAPHGLIAGAEVLTHAGGLPVAIPIAVALAVVLWRRDHRRAAIIWGTGFSMGQALVLGLKVVLNRTRPRAPDLLMQDFSFPSGHAFTAVVLYGAVLYGGWIRSSTDWQRGLLALATGGLIVTVGGSRLLLRVHYPTDVLAGYLLGIAWLALLWMVVRR